MSEQLNTGDKQPEFWRWQENCWADETKDWRSAKAVTVGIDVGSVSSQCVIVADGELYAYNSMRTGYNSPDSARNAFKGVTEKTGLTLDDVHMVVGTGYGRVYGPEGLLNMVEMAFRAYDPCFGCATHALPGQMPLEITVRDADGNPLDVLKQYC